MLELIGQGLTNRQIAQHMFLAEKTAKNYVSSLLAKLGMHRRTEAAAFAVRHPSDHDGLALSSDHGDRANPGARVERPGKSNGPGRRPGPKGPGRKARVGGLGNRAFDSRSATSRSLIVID